MMRRLSVLFSLIAASPAIAEICDKARPSWNPDHGPVSQLDDLTLFFTEPVGLIILALTAISIVSRTIWFIAFTVLMLMVIVAASLGGWLAAHDIIVAAASEGCATAPYLTSLVLMCIAGGLAAMGWRRWRKIKQAAPAGSDA